MSNKPIYVTQPLLPSLDEFIPYLENIWSTKQLTNNGPYHQQLEQGLCDYLGVDHVVLFNNGTIALLTALKALDVAGEVITTPYSFVATAHSLLWSNIKPVFADIEPDTLNIDPYKIEASITSETTAVLPVHCYGTPCKVDVIKDIADRHNLRIIYDAAHAFGVEYRGQSILKHGDLSVLSFHATKVFNTFEGGAIVCSDAETKQYIDYLKNFGFADEVTVIKTGINGKMSEINAAFGLLQLRYIDRAIEQRREVDQTYRSSLKGIAGISCIELKSECKSNHSYFPILVENDYGISRDELYQKLRDHQIYARRYFYPLISEFPMYRHLPTATLRNLPVASDIAERILCLPIYPELAFDEQERIISLISDSVR